MIFLERWEMNLAGKDILQFPIPDNDILAIIENLKLKPFVKAQSLVAMLEPCSVDPRRWLVCTVTCFVTVCVAKRDAMMDSKFDVALSSYFFIFHPPLYFWTIWPINSMVDSRAVRIWWLIRFSYGNKRGKVVERVVACTDGPEEKQRRNTNGKKIVFANT